MTVYNQDIYLLFSCKFNTINLKTHHSINLWKLSVASVLPRKALHRNLFWGFHLGPSSLKMRFRTQKQTECKHERFRNAAFWDTKIAWSSLQSGTLS